MNAPSFSIVLIARNAEKTLGRLLTSLADFKSRGGEIVLVDTGSSDRTAHTAREFGCVVEEVGDRFLYEIGGAEAAAINQEFVQGSDKPIVEPGIRLFNFSAARNYAASLAKNEMVFAIDADEYVENFDIDFINGAIDANMEQLLYKYVHSHAPDGSPDIVFDRCHIYDRRKLHWVGIIHETLGGGTDRLCKLPEERLTVEHGQNLETNRGGYLPGLALDCFLNRNNDRNSHYFARELMWSGRTHSAIQEFCRHISMNAWVQERAQSMIFLGDCWKTLGRDFIALHWWHKAGDTDPSRREVFLRIAKHYYEKQNHLQTAIYAQGALQIPRPATLYYADGKAAYEELPHELLYWALYWLDRKDDARFHWVKALNYAPDSERIKRDAQFFQ